VSSTPHMSIRVQPDQLASWRAACAKSGVDVSSKIRLLMDAWVAFESQREELERSESEMAAAEALKLIEEALISLS
jgi:hypothetical protein